jgi:TetR/AcrR family transcriptional regulator, cholesterol catabolism regulator
MSVVEEPRRGPTPKGLAAQKRVIDEALTLFQEQGYRATSIRQVAEAAGLAKATVYHHYPTKAAILYEIHNVFMETLEEGMERIEASGEGAQERLRAIIQELWRVMVSHRPHVQIFFEEWRHLDHDHLEALRGRRDRYYGFVRETVAETGAGGSSSAHTEVLTLAVFGMCNWGYQWFDPDGPLKASQIADDYADLVVAGFSARADAGARLPAAPR